MSEAAGAGTGAPGAQEWPSGASSLTRGLHRALQRVREADARRPLVWDLLLPAVMVPVALADSAGGSWRATADDPGAPALAAWLVSAGFVLPLPWRRYHPVAVMWMVSAAGLADAWAGVGMETSLLQLIVLYGVALRRPLSRAAWMGACLAAQITGTVVRWHPDDLGDRVGGPAMMCAVVVLAAIAVRARRDYTASLLERARQLETERDQQAQLAAAAERTRIAREMHDIIGHHLSVITGLADGGSYAVGKRPERAVQALGAIATTSREALGELRKLLGVLREPGDPGANGSRPAAELAPQPALADLDQLVRRVREAGLAVRLRVSGDGGGISPGRQLTVYRIVQESLTNTLKHAGTGASATVTVACAPDGTGVEVADSGGPAPAGAGRAAGGQGIHGMRRRAELYHGTLEAGPLPSGGWRVRVHLPADRGEG